MEKVSEIISKVSDVYDLGFLLSNLGYYLFMLGSTVSEDDEEDRLSSAICALEEDLQKLLEGLDELSRDEEGY